MATEITEGIDPEFQGWFAQPPAPGLPPLDPFEERELPYSTESSPDPEPASALVPDLGEPDVEEPDPAEPDPAEPADVAEPDVEEPDPAEPADEPEPRAKIGIWPPWDRARKAAEQKPPEVSDATSAFAAFSFGAPAVEGAARGDSGRWLDTHLLTVLAVAAALPALRIAAAWVVVCAIAAMAMLAVASVRGQAKEKGSADVVVVPARVVGRMLLGAINPLNWLKVLLGALASLTAGAAVAAVIAAVRWIATEGTDGILAAIRQGVWTHAPTYGAVFACLVLLRGVGKTRERRTVALYRVTRRLPEVAIAGVTVFVAVAGVSLALAGPRADVGFIRDSDGLGWVPVGLRSAVDGLRDDAVAHELSSMTACLNTGQAGLWTSWYTADNSLDDADAATLVADATRAPDQGALAATALVAHNHLASWVEVINVAVGDQVMLTVDRRGLPHDIPLTDAAALRDHTVGTPEWLTTVAPTVNPNVVLDCSARTPF